MHIFLYSFSIFHSRTGLRVCDLMYLCVKLGFNYQFYGLKITTSITANLVTRVRYINTYKFRRGFHYYCHYSFDFDSDDWSAKL